MNQFIISAWEIIRNGLDILFVWLVFYALLKVFKNNARTIQIVKGIIYVILAKFIADYLDLKSVNFILNYVLNWGVLAVIVIFQPEIRSLLERLGQTTRNGFGKLTVNEKDYLLKELIPAVEALSQTKTGALITIQRDNSLEDYAKNGKMLNSLISKELLTSIFVTTTPLHDGAVIVAGNTVVCASAFFPSTESAIPSRYGARHRAAVGISEVTDSVTIVVSEETGQIATTMQGRLTVFDSASDLLGYLDSVLAVDEDRDSSALSFWRKMVSSTKDESSRSIKDILDSDTSQMKLPIKHIDESKQEETHNE